MTDQQHPITPPPELIREWAQNRGYSCANELWEYLATQAARWGADQELEACCEWLEERIGGIYHRELRAARRPKPPSLKEQALEAMGRLDNEEWCQELEIDLAVVRKALESLPS